MQTVIFTVPGTDLRYSFPGESSLDAQQKKKLRLEIATALPKKYIPLHACLVTKGDRSLILMGASKSGKSTLAGQLAPLGFTVAANDFIAVWEDLGKVYAADINYEKENQGKHPAEVSCVVLLTPHDPRDAYVFNSEQIVQFYGTTLPELSPQTVRKICKKPLFTRLFRNHIVLGNRQSPQRWLKILNELLQQAAAESALSHVGIIGVGTIGQDVANLLLAQDWIQRVHLYSRDFNRLLSLTKDLKSANGDVAIYPHHDAKKVFESSELVVLSFNSTETSPQFTEERKRKVVAHAKIIWDLSRKIRNAQFRGQVLVVTNPVDILSWALYYFSNVDDTFELDWKGLYSHQVVGVGLGLDYHRLRVITSKQLELLGEHGEGLILTINQDSMLFPHEDQKILTQIKSYSEQIRRFVSRTRFGPTHEVLRIIREMRTPTGGAIRYSTLDSKGVFLGSPGVLSSHRLFQHAYSLSAESQALLLDAQHKQESYYKEVSDVIREKV